LANGDGFAAVECASLQQTQVWVPDRAKGSDFAPHLSTVPNLKPLPFFPDELSNFADVPFVWRFPHGNLALAK
jgi:hypothetical protein